MSQARNLPSSSSRIAAALSYVLLIVGGIFVMITRRDDPFALHHARQSIAMVITLILAFIIWGVIAWFLAMIPLIGPILATSTFALVMIVAMYLAVLWLFAIIGALQARWSIMPLVSRVYRRMFGEV